MAYKWEYGETCQSCGCKYPYLHRDHKIPRSEGGSNDPSNIWLICPNCHDLKTREERDRYYSPERREKISKRMKGNKNNVGRVTKESTKRKIGKANRTLTVEEVLKLRELREQGMSYEDLGLTFGISQATAWKYVEGSRGERAIEDRIAEIEKQLKL